MRRVLHQIRQKSGHRRPNKHSWSAHPQVIGRCPEHFNSQLKFAGSSAEVTKIHSSVGLLVAAWRSAHGGPKATVGNFCYAGQTGTARAPPGRRTDACGWPLDHLPILVPQLLIVMWSLGHRTMPVRSSCDHPRCLLGLCCACVLFYVVLCCCVYIIYWIILNNKNKILIMLLIYYFLSCIVLPCVYQKYYYWNKCCYVFSVLLAFK